MFEIPKANISLKIHSNGKFRNSVALSQEPDYNPDGDFYADPEQTDLVILEKQTQWHACLETLQGVLASHNQVLFLNPDKDGFVNIENSPVELIRDMTIEDEIVNHDGYVHIILGAENLESALNDNMDMYLDNELVREWGNMLDDEFWNMTHDYLKKNYPQYVYAFRDYAPLTPYKAIHLEYHVLGALMTIVADNHHEMYFRHDGNGNGTMMENRFNNNVVSGKEQYIRFADGDVERFKTILDLYGPRLDLHETTTHQWMDWCINTLSDDNRLEFYGLVKKHMGMVSTEIIRNLARRNINNTKVLGEIITLIPGCITHMAEHEMARYVNFLQSLSPEQCDNALSLAMYSQKDQINRSETTQKQMFFNILKTHACDKLEQLNCIDLVKEYNRTAQMESLFVTNSIDLKEINLSFNTQDIYYYLGLSGSLVSEVDKWFKNILGEIFSDTSLIQYWGIEEYKIVTNKNQDAIISHNPNNTLSLKVRTSSRFNEQLMQEGFNQILKEIRTQNPETIYQFQYDINKWLNKYWLNASLEQSLSSEEASDMNANTNSARIKNKI